MKVNKDIKFLCVEDGSVDVDVLRDYIDLYNLDIYVLVYRQGSREPFFLNEEVDNEKNN